MASQLYNIVLKELREIFRDPKLVIGMIIVPMLIFPIMGMAIGASMEASQKALEHMDIAVMNLDRTDNAYNLSDQLVNTMARSNLTLDGVPPQSLDGAIKLCINNSWDTIVVIPKNFTEVVSSGSSAKVYIYQVLTYYGLNEAAGAQRVESAISTFNAMLIASRLQASYPNSTYTELLVPAEAHSASVIRGQVQNVNPEVAIRTILATSTSMPIVIMLLIIMAGQLAATSVAMEKEQKTLEVLLTLPIKRINILIGKLAGVIVVSLIATLSYVIGFSYYMSSSQIYSTGTTNLSAIGLSPDPLGYVIMVVSLFLSFIAALSLAVMLSAYTQDVRSAQSLMSVLYVPIMIPSIILMIVPVEILPSAMQGLIYAIPFSYPILAARALYTHQYLTIVFGIVYQLIFTTVVLYLASKMFSSEKILTAKLSFSKKKGPPKE